MAQWWRIRLCQCRGEARDWNASLGQKIPWSGKWATCPSIPAWTIPWREELKWAAVHAVAKSQTRQHTHAQTGISTILTNSLQKMQSKWNNYPYNSPLFLWHQKSIHSIAQYERSINYIHNSYMFLKLLEMKLANLYFNKNHTLREETLSNCLSRPWKVILAQVLEMSTSIRCFIKINTPQEPLSVCVFRCPRCLE